LNKKWRRLNVTSIPDPAVSKAVFDEGDFGLSSRARDLLVSTFAAEPRISRALIYGSRAKGNYRPGSDIDIALDAPQMTYSDCLRLATTLDDLMLPWRIDLSLLHQIDNPDLLDHIARVGKPLWTKLS
jgi:uncharacterized protein